jgi:hypothetical protein
MGIETELDVLHACTYSIVHLVLLITVIVPHCSGLKPSAGWLLAVRQAQETA